MYEVLRWSVVSTTSTWGHARARARVRGAEQHVHSCPFWLLASRAGVQWYVSCITAAAHRSQALGCQGP